MERVTYSPEVFEDKGFNTTMEDFVPEAVEEVRKYPKHLYDQSRYFKFYALSFIIPLGLVFNTVASMIFLRKRLRKIKTAHYFIGLAAADSTVLLGEFLLWTSSFDSKGLILGLNFIHRNTPICRLIHFLRYMGRLWSSWLVVIICLDRYITIALPHINLSCLNVFRHIFRRPFVVVGGLALVSTALSCPAFFAVGVYSWKGDGRCLILKEFNDTYHVWRRAVMTVGELFLPSIIVSIFTVLIIIRLYRARHTAVGEERVSDRHNQDTPLIMSMLCVATCFVILRLPYIICYEMNINKRGMSAKMRYDIYVANQVSYVIAVANYAINFLLYVTSAVKFRTELLQMIRCNNTEGTTEEPPGDVTGLYIDQTEHDDDVPMKALHTSESRQVDHANSVSLPQTATT